MLFTHGESHGPDSKAPSARPDGHAQSTARPGERRVVRRQRFLRPERPPASEIRNAASRSPRRLHGEASRQGLWFFASVLLSGAGGVHPRWPGRAAAAETGTETRSQVVVEGRGIRRADHRRRSRSGLGRRRTAEVRHLRAPTEHRAGVDAREKKTTLAVIEHDRTDGSEQVERYEDLRRDVIGHAGGHRLGLALFQREGMKAWLDAWSTCTTRDAHSRRDVSDDSDRVSRLTLTD